MVFDYLFGTIPPLIIFVLLVVLKVEFKLELGRLNNFELALPILYSDMLQDSPRSVELAPCIVKFRALRYKRIRLSKVR